MNKDNKDLNQNEENLLEKNNPEEESAENKEDIQNEVNKFKPYENLSQLELPLLFVHGTIDTSVPVELSIETAAKCKNAKLELIEGGWHTFDNSKEALDNSES